MFQVSWQEMDMEVFLVLLCWCVDGQVCGAGGMLGSGVLSRLSMAPPVAAALTQASVVCPHKVPSPHDK